MTTESVVAPSLPTIAEIKEAQQLWQRFCNAFVTLVPERI
jgi:hypothetical protein